MANSFEMPIIENKNIRLTSRVPMPDIEIGSNITSNVIDMHTTVYKKLIGILSAIARTYI